MERPFRKPNGGEEQMEVLGWTRLTKLNIIVEKRLKFQHVVMSSR